jgi:DNA primase
MRITEAQVEQVRSASNIVDVIGDTVQLRKRGRNYTGLCPFHKEKTPSFSVLEDRGIFKCFGCGKAGDVFGFIMEMEKLPFPEAVERLARRANITLQLEHDPLEQQQQSERESVYVAARAAAGWFYKALRSPEGKIAQVYLTGRELGEAVLKKFGVGFALPRQGAMLAQLKSEGITEQSLEAAGVISPGHQSTPYERFRGRLIFPIFSATGRIIGFGGRVIPGVDTISPQAKYVNSPETSIYNKSVVLYGLFQAKEAIRKEQKAYLVEGYLDVLAMADAGIENVVAASGTSLTSGQLDVLKRYTRSVVLLFDADQAGKNAAMRGIELAIEAGFDVNTVILPHGEDPDSFLQNKGVEAFRNALKQEQSFIETKAQIFAELGMIGDPTREAQAIRSIVETIRKVPDGIKQELFVRKLATRFRLSETMLLTELRRTTEKHQRIAIRREELRERQDEIDIGQQDEPLREEIATPEAEKVLLKAALMRPEPVKRLLEQENFDIALVTHVAINHILGKLFELSKPLSELTTVDLLAEFRGDEASQTLIIDCSQLEQQPSEQWKDLESSNALVALQMAEQAMITILNTEITRKLDALKIKLSGPMDHDTERLMMEVQSLKELHERLKEKFSSLSSA